MSCSWFIYTSTKNVGLDTKKEKITAFFSFELPGPPNNSSAYDQNIKPIAVSLQPARMSAVFKIFI